MRWNCMSKVPHFLQITAEHQDYPFFTVFLTTKSLSQNISITLLQISLKLHEHRGCYWRKKLPWMIFEEQFPVPRYTAASKIGNSVISLLWQLRCRCNPDHNKFSSLSNTTVVAIFPNLCLWRRSLCSNLGGIDPEKLYQVTLMTGLFGLLVALVIDVKQKNSIALERKVQWQDSLGAKSTPVWGNFKFRRQWAFWSLHSGLLRL